MVEEDKVKRTPEYDEGFKAGRSSQGTDVSSFGGYPYGRKRDDYSGGFESGRIEGNREDYRVSTQVALLTQTIENLKTDLSEVNGSIKEIRGEIKNINDMANKYRGGLLVVLALGGIIGTLVTLSDKIVHWFH